MNCQTVGAEGVNAESTAGAGTDADDVAPGGYSKAGTAVPRPGACSDGEDITGGANAEEAPTSTSSIFVSSPGGFL